ncbi:hypothetical protein [Lysobacter humi (ex Lee et al. 2017)]
MATPFRATLALGLALASPAVAAQQRYEGLAYTAKGGALVYRETHWLYRDGATPARLVLYRCPDGRAFARKSMREVASATAPDFDYVDARNGYREGVRTRGGMREVTYRAGTAAEARTRPLPSTPGLVIDAGFDAWIRANWSRTGGGGAVVPFLVPSRAQAFDFRVATASDTQEGGRAVRRMRMAVAGVLGYALPSIELTYDAQTRRLLRFNGLGSVRDAKGRLQALRIEFPTAPTETGVTREEIDAALRTPLVASCAG